MMVTRSIAGLAFGCAIALTATTGTAVAQCTDCPSGTRVNPDYSPSPSGTMQVVRNRTLTASEATYSSLVSADPFSSTPRPIPMADPTVMKLGGWYYCTGTSADAHAANFPIYKSQNLRTWYFHMFAFPDANRFTFCPPPDGMECPPEGVTCQTCRSVKDAIRINGRVFKGMWAPELYRDPTDNRIYISFTTEEVFGTDRCECSGGPPPTHPTLQTLVLASMPTNDFRNAAQGGNRFFGATYSNEPLRYGYFLNNQIGAPLSDGSPAQGITDGGFTAGHAVATSSDMRTFVPGDPSSPIRGSGQLFRFQTIVGESDPFKNNTYGNSMMYLDGFPYRDPDNRLWMLYTWREKHANMTNDRGFDGNCVAAFPMINSRLMDASAGAALLPLAYRVTDWFAPSRGSVAVTCSSNPPVSDKSLCPTTPLPNGRLRNGMSAKGAIRFGKAFPQGTCEWQYGVAEGPAAFNANGLTYVLYSRNTWDSPAYCIVYRAVPGGISSAKLGSWTDAAPQEWSLVSSYPMRGNPNAQSYGHGEVFAGPGSTTTVNKYYVVFHAKEPGVCNTTRYVNFKELTFTAPTLGGNLMSGGSGETAATVVSAPEEDETVWPGGYESEDEFDDPPVAGPIMPIFESNKGGPDDVSLFLVPFLCPGDFDQDGQVQLSDLYAYLDKYFEGDVDADFNGDGLVTFEDLFQFLDAWFAVCQ